MHVYAECRESHAPIELCMNESVNKTGARTSIIRNSVIMKWLNMLDYNCIL